MSNDKMTLKIKHIDPTCIQILEGLEIAKECLSFKAEIWLQGAFKKQKKIITKDFTFKAGKDRYCYAGFVSRLKEHCAKRQIEFAEIGSQESLKPDNRPNLPGVTLRDYQTTAIESALLSQRGIIQAATGTGKTILSLGLISCFKKPKVLYLVPNLDLATQVANDFKKFGHQVSKLGGGVKEIQHDIVVSTIQTYSRLDLFDLSGKFDILILDEAHLASKAGATIEKILSTSLAPMRIALTATVPKETERRLLLEGLFGPIIFDMGLKKGIEMEILAKPKLKLLRVPVSKAIDEQIKFGKTYRNAVQFGIIENDSRNRIIANTAKGLTEKGKSVIIYVNEIAHLENISNVLNEIGVSHKKVQGILSAEERERIVNDFREKKNLCVVSTIWKEGTDIISLDAVILGGGGKAEKTQLQSIGRGLRRSEEKNEALIFDMLDPYRWLSEHCVQRISLFAELEWV